MKDFVHRHLYRPIPIYSAVFFRIAYGLLIAWELYRYWKKGWVWYFYIKPTFYFTYELFSWLKPLPPLWVYLLWAGLIVAALCVAIGFFYRVASFFLFLGLAYFFFLDKTHYLNHMYLIFLLALILSFLPLNRFCSVDVWLRRVEATSVIPCWVLRVLQFQIGIVYFYGAVAKWNYDWLVAFEPMYTWILNSQTMPFLKYLVPAKWMAAFFSWAGMLYDLLVVPGLLWKKTRKVFVWLTLFFHLFNMHFFHIGIFPYLMLAATTLYFEPDWCQKLFSRFLPCVSTSSSPVFVKVPFFIVGYVVFQVLFPLRYHFYKGNVGWTGDGEFFSWNMKMGNISTRTQFFIYDSFRNRFKPILDWRRYLTAKQASEMQAHPSMILQFAQYLQKKIDEKEQYSHYEVRVEQIACINHWPCQKRISRFTSLKKITPWQWAKSWLEPFHIKS